MESSKTQAQRNDRRESKDRFGWMQALASRRTRLGSLLALSLVSLIHALPSFAQSPNAALALAGEPAPGTDGGVYAFFGEHPTLNDNDEVAIFGHVVGGSAPTGIFVETASSGRVVVLEGDEAPGTGGGVFGRFHASDVYPIDQWGGVVFRATVNGGSASEGIFHADQGYVYPVALSGDPAPWDVGGTYSGFGPPSMSKAGQIAFAADIDGAWQGVTSGIFLALQAGTEPEAIVLNGDPVFDLVDDSDPDNPTLGVFVGHFSPTVDPYGSVSFTARVRVGQTTTAGYFRAQYRDSNWLLALHGDAAPGGGSFDFLSGMSRPAGEYFTVTFEAPLLGSTADSGIFSGDEGEMFAVARKGDAAPGTDGGTFDAFSTMPTINDQWAVAFTADLLGGSSPSGVFRRDGVMEALALVGDIAPGTGGGTFASFEDGSAINWNSNVAVSADVLGGSTTGGVFLLPEPSGGMSLFVGTLLMSMLGRRRQL